MLAFWILIAALLGVLVHELGHITVARWLGLPVVSINIGLGPKLFARTDRFGTRWMISLIPLSGSSSFFDGEDPGPPTRLPELSPLRRAAIYAAGPLANIVFAAGLLFVTFLDGSAVSTLAVTNVQSFVLLAGSFSLLLGLFNLIPLPPLDGGRLALLAIEAGFGARFSVRSERSILSAGTTTLTISSLVFSALVLGSFLF